jgi:CheY-like chemotaxis protein
VIFGPAPPNRYYQGMGRGALIVDDHAAIRDILALKFTAHGFDVHEAPNGTEGISRAEELRPDVIILDLSMPVMNGFEAARALKLSMPGVPLLMFTNTVGQFVRQEALAIGIASVFSKSDSCDLLVEDAKTRLGILGQPTQLRIIALLTAGSFLKCSRCGKRRLAC